MPTRDGDIKIIAGSRDPKTVTIYKEKGVQKEDSFVNSTGLTLHLKRKLDGAITSFTTPKVVFTDANYDTIRFTPAADDFVNADAGEYNYHFSLTDASAKPVKFPINPEKYILTIYANYES